MSMLTYKRGILSCKQARTFMRYIHTTQRTGQWGIWSANAAVVPLSPLHPSAELEYFLNDSKCDIVLSHGDLKPRLSALSSGKSSCKVKVLDIEEIISGPGIDPCKIGEIDENSPAQFIYTSGTTGKPKGVVHTRKSILAQVKSLADGWGLRQSDQLLHLLPLHHIHGIVVALATALYTGATVEMLEKFDSERVWNRIMFGEKNLSLIMGVPTIYSKLIQRWDSMGAKEQSLASDAVKQFRLTICGSAPLPISTFQKWYNITGHKMVERYGMSEIGIALSNDAFNPENIRVGSVGKPLPGVSVRLCDGYDEKNEPILSDYGEIQVKGDTIFKEYFGLPEKTRAEFTNDKWFKTGDIAKRSDEGIYYIQGRSSTDIIKSGGYKLSALEVENHLLDHPLVQDVAVAGIKDEQYGELLVAAIVQKRGVHTEELTQERLREWCKGRIASYKIPRKIHITDSLPRNLMGKVDKKNRGKADLVIRNATGQPLMRSGGRGRNTWNGSTATVFGCSGFLGRYLVARLAREGTRVVVPYRGESEAIRHLKPTGDLGMIIPMEYDVRNPEQIEECIAHSDVVYNLIGRNYETKNFSFEKVHIEAPTTIAEICHNAGIARFIHVSHISANGASDSRVMQAKALGESSVKSAFPDVTIVRPSTMYGYEDQLLNGICYWKHILLSPNSNQTLRPVNVSDVALALDVLRDLDDAAGETFELYGPKAYTYKELIDLCSFLLHEKIFSVNVPFPAYRLLARALDLAPFHYTSHHEADLLRVDENPSNKPGIRTFADLGIEPHLIELTALQYIKHYRSFVHVEEGFEPRGYKAFRKPINPPTHQL
ncbi:hypothetical protein H4219_000227 [Mycoemilia scoparia]|uniref:Uncharacterized protein n=1 Tax=Mycoemilia scoparia TaxID=417184 RepID=A0A9W8DWR3_9FUNG|nr:hypothetical protein H4219_000227 [Mycoemilia scoparia]